MSPVEAVVAGLLAHVVGDYILQSACVPVDYLPNEDLGAGEPAGEVALSDAALGVKASDGRNVDVLENGVRVVLAATDSVWLLPRPVGVSTRDSLGADSGPMPIPTYHVRRVLGRRSRQQMCGVAARPVVAGVAKQWWNLADGETVSERVCHSVGTTCAAHPVATAIEYPVSVCADSAKPWPTEALLRHGNLAPETADVFRGQVQRHKNIIVTRGVLS